MSAAAATFPLSMKSAACGKVRSSWVIAGDTAWGCITCSRQQAMPGLPDCSRHESSWVSLRNLDELGTPSEIPLDELQFDLPPPWTGWVLLFLLLLSFPKAPSLLQDPLPARRVWIQTSLPIDVRQGLLANLQILLMPLGRLCRPPLFTRLEPFMPPLLFLLLQFFSPSGWSSILLSCSSLNLASSSVPGSSASLLAASRLLKWEPLQINFSHALPWMSSGSVRAPAQLSLHTCILSFLPGVPLRTRSSSSSLVPIVSSSMYISPHPSRHHARGQLPGPGDHSSAPPKRRPLQDVEAHPGTADVGGVPRDHLPVTAGRRKPCALAAGLRGPAPLLGAIAPLSAPSSSVEALLQAPVAFLDRSSSPSGPNSFWEIAYLPFPQTPLSSCDGGFDVCGSCSDFYWISSAFSWCSSPRCGGSSSLISAAWSGLVCSSLGGATGLPFGVVWSCSSSPRCSTLGGGAVAAPRPPFQHSSRLPRAMRATTLGNPDLEARATNKMGWFRVYPRKRKDILCPTPMLIGFSAFHFAFSCLVHKTSQRSHWQGSFHSFMNIYEHHLNMEANPLSHHLKVVLKCLECPYIGLFKIEHPKIVRWIIRATIHSPTLSWTSAK